MMTLEQAAEIIYNKFMDETTNQRLVVSWKELPQLYKDGWKMVIIESRKFELQ